MTLRILPILEAILFIKYSVTQAVSPYYLSALLLVILRIKVSTDQRHCPHIAANCA